MERQLLWNGRLHTVGIPYDLSGASERDIWSYVQHRVAANMSVEQALYAVFTARYHGIGWSPIGTPQPIPFGLSVFGESGVVASPSLHGKSSRGGPSHNRSQMPSVPPSSRAKKHAVSDNEGRSRRPAPPPTSNASRPSALVAEGAPRARESHLSKRYATPHTATRWAGRTTMPATSPGVRVA